MDYTGLSLAEVRAGLEDVARETEVTFGRLDAGQLNWRPDASQWGVGQCFEHLFTANRLLLQSAKEALEGRRPRTVWQRLPLLPAAMGRMLIKSQAPPATKKFKASSLARPTSAGVAADVVRRFVEHEREAAAWMQTIDERAAARTIMSSPYTRLVTYSVLDGCRLTVAHDRRHFEQARRVMELAGFPAS